MSLLDQYRTLHAQGKFLGLSVVKFADDIAKTIEDAGCKTALDFGAGQGHQYMPPHSLDKKWGLDVTCYDPAVLGMEKLPLGKFDLVLCCDVLEHIPEDELDDVIKTVFSKAERCAFFVVCCREAKKKLPDGRNVHLTIKPLDWWESKIGRHETVVWRLRETP